MAHSISQEQIPRLLAGLSSPYSLRRKDDAKALGRVGESSTEIVKALFSLANADPDPSVRETARVALTAPIHQPIIAQLETEYAARQQDTSSSPKLKQCPYCAEMIQEAAIVCRYCGREMPTKPDVPFLLPSTTPVPKPKKWYMSPAVKILTFLFLTPIWTLIELEDPDSSLGVKILAAILLVLYVLFICVPLLMPRGYYY